MIDYSSKVNTKLRKSIWNNILALSTDKKECEIKLQKLFQYKHFNSYFYKLDTIHYYLKAYTQQSNNAFIETLNIKKIVFLCIDALIEYEYFHSFKIKQDGYDYKKIKEKYDDIKKYIINENDVVLKIPQHPHINYEDTTKELITVHKLNKDDVCSLMNILFELKKKPKKPLSYKKELQQIPKLFDEIKETLINSPEHNHDFFQKTAKQQKKALENLDIRINKWRYKINH
jgi:hypothetical protein